MVASVERTTAQITLAAAVVSLVTAIMAAPWLAASDDDSVARPQPSETQSSAPSETESSSAAEAPATDLDSSTPAGGEIVEVDPLRHQGEVTLAVNGDRIDLNAPSTDPRWGGDNSGYDWAELEEDGLHLWSISHLRLDAGLASYESCSAATGYADVPGALVMDPASLDGRDCFELYSGRFASIVTTSNSGERATFRITTWNSV